MNRPEVRLKKKWRKFKAVREKWSLSFSTLLAARTRQDTHIDTHADVHAYPMCAYGRLRFHIRIFGRVRHVTSTRTVINQARRGNASIRAVRHTAKTNAHANTLAHAWPEWQRGSLHRSNTSASKCKRTKSRVAGIHPQALEHTHSW